ncbi:Signal peptidase IB [Eubacterium plexicaudatum ASF492]|uniref:Signal peptidase I n=1 Tax=Eubacterium plexicaudatum ASF492 TaxID=1235802 RepID=N2AI49_9FIRM|nr:Signal peptidase IB [Eubacterium plexicaudatum ASF492]
MAKNAKSEKTEMEEQKRPWWKELLSYVWIILFACVAAMAVNRYVLINAEIPSESMENLLTVDDRIFGCRLSYVFGEPERYDVVMFRYPVHEDTIYIKRIIGLPGETVEIRKGKIYIDGSETPIEEDYLPEKWTDGNDGYLFEVPKDSYLMLGDNRNLSEDARYWAQCALDDEVASNKEEAQKYTYVREDQMIGRAILKYYPKFHLFLNI